jgi:gluconate 5-dehydrogenase
MSGNLVGLAGIVTGAGSGIGAALAEGLAERGARVALLDLNREAAERVAAQIGEGASVHQVDVADEAAVEGAIAAAEEQLGSIDFLVNNAGIRHQASILEHTAEIWQHTLDVNLLGVFRCSQAVIPQMIGNGGGRIVNVASIAGILALKNRIAYASSKAGVIGMTKAMALELGEHGINVNAVAPGVIETPLIASYFEDPELAQAIVEAIPVGRWGQPADLVGPIAFLCGPDAEYVSGQTLAVDGAWTAGKGY